MSSNETFAKGRVLSLLREQYEQGERENYAVYESPNGEFYVAAAGKSANDQRVATLADFEPDVAGNYILALSRNP